MEGIPLPEDLGLRRKEVQMEQLAIHHRWQHIQYFLPIIQLHRQLQQLGRQIQSAAGAVGILGNLQQSPLLHQILHRQSTLHHYTAIHALRLDGRNAEHYIHFSIFIISI